MKIRKITNQKCVDQLMQLPNIGKTLAEKLVKVKVSSPEKLIENGSVKTFIRLREIDKEACFSELCALEGAIHGKRWHDLNAERKVELKELYELIKR